MTAAAQTGTREILIAMPDRVHANLASLAKYANVTLATYTTQLFMAAYTARMKPPTGDRDLDAVIARVVILDAIEATPPEDIAAYVELSVPTVKAIIKAWHDELAGRRAMAP